METRQGTRKRMHERQKTKNEMAEQYPERDKDNLMLRAYIQFVCLSTRFSYEKYGMLNN